ncbi:hypothetical protein MTP99_019736 [Tenebrio molitor]|nr:hypothetical protein MTP99_019736 [Tenebrio molitor]
MSLRKTAPGVFVKWVYPRVRCREFQLIIGGIRTTIQEYNIFCQRIIQLGCSNYHNLHIWAEENPRELFPRGFQHRFSVNLWTGLLGNRLASISVVDPLIC